MKNLESLLDEEGLKSFLEKVFTKLPFSANGTAQKMGQTLNWDVVQKIIDDKKSILRVVKDGQMVKDYASFDFNEAKMLYDRGHTLLIKNAELSHEAFKEMADDFSKSFFTPVDIQLYCTPEGHNAFSWHYDVEEVFIVQAKGSKEYTIRQNSFHPNPLVASIPKASQGFENETSQLSMKVLLKEGDWLYIPSGWWHRAETRSESMHISIGLMPKAAVDFTEFLPKYLSQFPFWRQRLPLLAEFSSSDEEKLFYQEAMAKFGQDLKEKFSSPEFLVAVLKHLKNPSK